MKIDEYNKWMGELLYFNYIVFNKYNNLVNYIPITILDWFIYNKNNTSLLIIIKIIICKGGLFKNNNTFKKFSSTPWTSSFISRGAIIFMIKFSASGLKIASEGIKNFFANLLFFWMYH